MYIFDWKFKENPANYFIQCGVAIFTMVLILLFLDVLEQAALIASLGATVFTVFSMPRSFLCNLRSLLGGYVVGISSGIFFGKLMNMALSAGVIEFETTALGIFGAVAVGVAMFIMAVTNTEHAPAAGIALGLVLNPWNINVIIFIIGAVLFVYLVREACGKHLINLIGKQE
ncbi:MAG: HPP family protein [Elusimicrobiota bacterium]